MRYRYLVIGLINEIVFGTDDRKDAKVYTGDENYIVIDAEAGIVMKEGEEGSYSVLSMAEAFDLDSVDSVDSGGDGDGLGDLDDPDDPVGQTTQDDLVEVTYHLVDEERPRTAQARRPNSPFDYLRGKYGRQE